MNQARREFSLINSIVGRSVAGHTRRSAYAGRLSGCTSGSGPSRRPARGRLRKHASGRNSQPLAPRRRYFPHTKGSSRVPLQSTAKQSTMDLSPWVSRRPPRQGQQMVALNCRVKRDHWRARCEAWTTTDPGRQIHRALASRACKGRATTPSCVEVAAPWGQRLEFLPSMLSEPAARRRRDGPLRRAA